MQDLATKRIRLALRIFAVLCLASLFWMLKLARFERGPAPRPPSPACTELPRGFSLPTLALEFVQSPAQADCIAFLAKGTIEPGLEADRIVISLYGSILFILSLLCFRNGRPGCRPLGIVAGICAMGAALCDVLENRGMWLLLGGSREQSVIDGVRAACYWKWSLLAAAFLLLAVFLARSGPWAWLPAALLLFAGGSVAAHLLLGRLPRLEGDVNTMLGALLTVVFLFLVHPQSVLPKRS